MGENVERRGGLGLCSEGHEFKCVTVYRFHWEIDIWKDWKMVKNAEARSGFGAHTTTAEYTAYLWLYGLIRGCKWKDGQRNSL